MEKLFLNNVSDKTKVGDKIVDWKLSLIIDGQNEVKIEPLPLAFLKFLYEHPGEVITREQLIESVWHNRHVSDDAIRRVVKKLRSALGDDAKSPSFIKTYPLQGYMLIADISHPTGTMQIKKPINKFAVYALISLIMLSSLGIFNFINSTTATANSDFDPIIKKLTHLSGSEIIADYCEQIDTILFTYRTNNDAPYALFSKNLTSQTVHRLSFNDNNYFGAFFSPDCSQVALNINNKSGVFHYISQFSQEGITGLKLIPKEKNQNEQGIVSWTSDGKGLYFEVKNNARKRNTGSVISKYNIDSNNWQQVTFSQPKGLGDFYAKESFDGQYLIVLRNTAQRRVSLLVLDLFNKKTIVERHVPFHPSEIVWLKGEDNQFDFALSSFKGDFYYYNIVEDKLTRQLGSKPGINDVFYHCGDKCFFMRKHDMNYTDIKEIPNPFINNSSFSGLHLESDNADFNPIYSHDGTDIYFTSKNDVTAKLMRRTEQGETETLYQFNPRHILHSLAASFDNKYLTGKIEDRIFIFNLQSKTIEFISSEQAQVFSPLWDKKSKNIYFSRIEHDQLVLQKYNLDTNSTSEIEAGIFARYETKNADVYLLDEKHNLYHQKENDSRELIINLGNKFSQHWQIVNEHLYFTKHNKVDINLHRLNLKTREVAVKPLFKNSWNFEFELHPDGNKLLITQFLLARSDLVKVYWQ